jgi:hypothetical protein
MERDRSWIGLAMGVLFIVLIVVSVILTGEGKDPTENSAVEIADFYSENDDEQILGAVLAGIAMIPFLFFAGALRKVLYDAQGGRGYLPTVAWGGALVIASGVLANASLQFALADYAGDIDPTAAQGLNAFLYDFFLPFPIGMSILLLGAGLSAVKSGALPRWLAWVAIVLGVLALAGPVGFFAFLVGMLWILVVSILLARRARNAPGGAPPPTPTATAA